MYFYDATNSSSLFGIAPWDLDHSWGRDYQGNALEANKNFLLYNRVHTCLRTYYGSYNYVKERYQELRTNELRTDSLKARFHRVFQLYRENQVDEREEIRWNGQDDIVLDFDAEEEYIQQWIDQRLAYLDAKYDFDEELGIRQTMASALPYYNIRISMGMLHIQATKAVQLQVSNMQGNDVYRKNMQEGESVDLPLPCGIYLVNKAKLFVP